MWLNTEELDEVPDVSPADIDRLLAGDSFGKFAVLSASEGDFIQAGSDWQPDDECRAFLRQHTSDPWVLEYREAGRQFRAAGYVTLEQVRDAFRLYRSGGAEWRTTFAWVELRPGERDAV